MVSQLFLGIVNFMPAVAVLYVAIGKHEDHFRHNAMFLVLLAGMALGLAAGFAELFILDQSGFLIVIFALPLVETMVKTMILGLPRFRGNQETVLLGGGVGLGLATLILMTYSQVIRDQPISWQLVVTLLAVSIGFTLVHFVSGMVLGKGPAEGSAIARFLPSYGMLVPAHVFIVMLGLTDQGCTPPLEICVKPLVSFPDVEWALMLLAYGALLAWALGPRYLKQGLPPEAQRAQRREEMARARGER